MRLGENVSTLLGPEGTTVVLLFQRLGQPPVWGLEVCQAWPGLTYRRFEDRVWCGADRVVGWSFVENCTVDASIFVVKLSRANGECLGTRSR